MPIRVLIVDDVENTREDIKRFLYFEEDLEVVGEAGTGEEAVELAQEVKPDVVLMDINLPGMDGIAATEIISVQVPETAIIIISIQGEQEYLKKAMAAGARDYLVKPFTSTDLAETVRRANAFARKRHLHLVGGEEKQEVRSMRHGKVITLFSTKGGVGKTTVACNLAIAMAAETHRDVALVDLDLQGGDVSVILNFNEVHTIADLVKEDMENDPTVTDTCMAAHFSGINVLCAPVSPELAELVTPQHINTLVSYLKSKYDFVVIDTPPHYSEINLNVLEMSDQVLVMLAQDLPTLKHTRSTTEVLNALNHKEKTKLVLNRLRADGISVKELENSLGMELTAAIPTDDKTVVQSVNKGQPFVLSQKNSKVSECIIELAKKVTTETKENKPQKRPAGGIQSIKKIFSLSR